MKCFTDPSRFSTAARWQERVARDMEKRDGSVEHFIAEDAAHRRLRLGDRRSGFEPADNRQTPVTHIARTAFIAGIANTMCVGDRQPNIVIAARSDSSESLFGYADNRERDIVQFNPMADYVGSGAEGALPVAIVQHSDGCSGRSVVRCVE